LTYDLELERNSGDWRLRKDPSQKRVNGKPPARAEGEESTETKPEADGQQATEKASPSQPEEKSGEETTAEAVAQAVEDLSLSTNKAESPVEEVTAEEEDAFDEEAEDDSDGEWISKSRVPDRTLRMKTDEAATISSKQHQEIPSQAEHLCQTRASSTSPSSGSYDWRYSHEKRRAEDKSQVRPPSLITLDLR
jgi:hypothetical protein